MKRLLCLILLFVPFSAATQSKYHLPLDPPLIVSGTFGELRSSHFHSGVDFSTRKLTGLPVYAAEKGFLARIKVAPDGYGNALYLRLVDGHTAVYAHLDQFSKKIEDTVWKKQIEEKKSFVDFSLEPGKLPVERGEVIGFSGDSGEVPPHLHFELRNGQEHPLNPLTEAFSIPDGIPPKMMAVHLIGLEENQLPAPYRRAQLLVPAWDPAAQKYLLSPQKTPHPLTGIEVAVQDESSGNRCAALEVSLYIDGELHFERRHSQFSFEEYPHPFVVYNRRLWLDKKGIFERLYLYPRADLSFQNSSFKTEGGVLLKRGESKRIRLVTRDAAGNESTLEFKLIRSGKINGSSHPSGSGWQRVNPETALPLRAADGGARLDFPKNSVFASSWARLRPISDKRFASAPLKSPIYRAEPRDFLLREKATLSIPLPKEESNGIGLYQWEPDKEKWKFVKGQERGEKEFRAPIGAFGSYALLRDGEPPRISNLRKETGPDGALRLIFNVDDNLSGIDYRAIQITCAGQPLIYEVNANRKEVCFKLSQINNNNTALIQLQIPDHAKNNASQSLSSAFGAKYLIFSLATKNNT